MLGMMNCQEAARLVSESRDRRLPFGRRLALRFHLTMCRVCKIYSRQIDLLGEVSRRANHMILQASLPMALSADAKARIKQRLLERE